MSDPIEEAREAARKADHEKAFNRPRKSHPRDGYVVAVYVGSKDGVQVLVEVHEAYNAWGDDTPKRYHYRPYDLTCGKRLEVKTIGGIDEPEWRGDLPPRFVQGQFPFREWRRLR